jgi:hypothetical protein
VTPDLAVLVDQGERELAATGPGDVGRVLELVALDQHVRISDRDRAEARPAGASLRAVVRPSIAAR